MQKNHNILASIYKKSLISFLVFILLSIFLVLSIRALVKFTNQSKKGISSPPLVSNNIKPANTISYNQLPEANKDTRVASHNNLVDPSYEENNSDRPTVRTLPSDMAGDRRPIIYGIVVDDSKKDCSQTGFDYRPQGSTEWISWTQKVCNKNFSYVPPNISTDKKYEFRAKALNSAGWGYGSILSTTISSSSLMASGQSRVAQYNVADTTILPIIFDHQDETYTCEAAAAKMALAYLGYPVSERDILDRTGRVGPSGDPNQNFVEGYGVHPGPVARAINMINNGASATEWSGDINALYQRLVVGGVTVVWMNQSFGAGYHEHAVTVMGFRNGNILYMDPWYGQMEESVDTFVGKWWGWGVAINSSGINPVYRFYNISNGTHFYTASSEERDNVGRRWGTIYRYEGVVYNLTNNGGNVIQLYRFWNTNGTHFYTASPVERDNIVRSWPNIYKYEGVAYYVAAAGTPVYRFYNISNGTHFYTASVEERDRVGRLWGRIYRYEGEAYYVQ